MKLLAFAPVLLLAGTPSAVPAAQARGGRAGPADAPRGDDDGQRLTFDWGQHGSVAVRETETLETPQGPEEVHATSELLWTTQSDGIWLRRQPRVPLAADGAPAQATATMLRARQMLDALAPPVLLDPSGAFRGFAPAADPEQLAGKLGRAGLAELAGDLRALRSVEASRSRARWAARDAWEAWFGAWQGRELGTGGPLESERPAYPGFGLAPAPARVRLTYAGDVEYAGEPCVHLELVIEHEAAALAAAASASTAPPEAAAAIEGIEGRTVELHGVFGVATGRPHRVTETVTTEWDDGQGGVRTKVEHRDYAFDWANARILITQEHSGAAAAATPRTGPPPGSAPAPKQKPPQGQKGPKQKAPPSKKKPPHKKKPPKGKKKGF